MMHKSPAFHWIAIASKLVAGIAAIFVGLVAFGYDALDWQFLKDNPNVVLIARYLILAAGVILILAALWKIVHGCHECHCGKVPCACDRKPNSPYAS